MNEVAGLIFPEVVLEIEPRIIICKEPFLHDSYMDNHKGSIVPGSRSIRSGGRFQSIVCWCVWWRGIGHAFTSQ